MSATLLDRPRVWELRAWPSRHAEIAEALVADSAPGEAPARWVGGQDDRNDLLWVATERRILLLAQGFNRRALRDLAYGEVQGIHLAREPAGARIRLYAGGTKFVLEEGNLARGEEFVRYVHGWLPTPAGRHSAAEPRSASLIHRRAGELRPDGSRPPAAV